MSKYNYAPGAIHIDHHKDLNIDVKSFDDAIRLMSAFLSDRAEDVEPVQEEKPAKGLFCRITKAAYDKGVAQQVDDDLRSASVSAPKLVKVLNTNDALGYTDTKNLPSTKLYKLLDEQYGLSFDVRAFQIARSK